MCYPFGSCLVYLLAVTDLLVLCSRSKFGLEVRDSLILSYIDRLIRIRQSYIRLSLRETV